MVDISVYSYDPFEHYIGYTYKIDGDKLFVGVEGRIILGVLPGDSGSIHFQIPIEKQINQVYQCFHGNEILVWSIET